jgi:hypothetical protein
MKRDALGFCFKMQEHTFLISDKRLKLTKAEFIKKFTCTREYTLDNYDRKQTIFNKKRAEKIYNMMHDKGE